MWFYNETDALIDTCTLTSAEQTPIPPMVTSSNLLENPDFDNAPDQMPDNWQGLCAGGIRALASGGRTELQVFDGACALQALSASDILLLEDAQYELRCEVDFHSNRALSVGQYEIFECEVSDIPGAEIARLAMTIRGDISGTVGETSDWVYVSNE